MNVKTSIITLWSYLTEAFDIDNIAAAFEETIGGFEFSVDKFSLDTFEYEKFGIEILRRDLIGVYSVGYA